MAEHQFDLIDGITTGEGDKAATHKRVTLRTLTSGDLEDAALEAERVIRDEDGGVALATSPVLMSNAILRRQVIQLGGIMGPLPAPLFRKFSAADLELLQAEAELLDAASRRAGEAALKRGRIDESQAGDQSAGTATQ